MRACADINELRRNAELVSFTARAAFDHIINAKLCPELAYIRFLTARSISGIARDDLKLGIPGERRGHILGQSIRKVRLVTAAAHGREGHDGNGGSGVCAGLVERSAAGIRLTIAASGRGEIWVPMRMRAKAATP